MSEGRGRLMTLDATAVDAQGRGDGHGGVSSGHANATSTTKGRGSMGSVRGMAARFQRPSELLQAEFDVILPGGQSKKPKPFLCILQG